MPTFCSHQVRGSIAKIDPDSRRQDKSISCSPQPCSQPCLPSAFPPQHLSRPATLPGVQPSFIDAAIQPLSQVQPTLRQFPPISLLLVVATAPSSAAVASRLVTCPGLLHKTHVPARTVLRASKPLHVLRDQVRCCSTQPATFLHTSAIYVKISSVHRQSNVCRSRAQLYRRSSMSSRA